MPKEDSSKQLTISFDHDPLITDELSRGNFLTFVEVAFKDGLEDKKSASALIGELSRKYPSDMAFVIRTSETTVQELSKLKQTTLRPFVLTLSGQHASMQKIREDAAQARSFGIRNFLLVTGDLAQEDIEAMQRKNVLPANDYTDSVAALSILNEPQKGQALSCVVNPFMYTPESSYMQYAKLIRKITAGARMIIMQAGWDIRKAQELQWYLQMREQILPIIARVRLVSTAEAAALGNSSIEPGITVPVPIAAKLMRLKDTPEKFWAYQEEFISLLAIGYRKLGFAGMLIAGSADSAQVMRILDAVNELDKEVTSYNDWRVRWLQFLEDATLDPPPTLHSNGSPFFLFENLLAPDLPLFNNEVSRLARVNFPKPPYWTALKTSLLAPNAKSALAKLAKMFVKPDPRFHICYGLNNAACPKRLSIGPCGNARSDGWCEANHAPCFFNCIAEIAASRNELALLEG